MGNVDKRGVLDDAIFDYQSTKDGRVLLYWHGKHIKTLAGEAARKFMTQIENAEGKDAQLIMAKATGHFKHGNERRK
ncbi:MAG: hypothetical protein J0L63_01460 [Anaerolineae bacterium]|nr:hypothetical protein [Anaerolineae bacterium]MBN8617539.1 hypothetical protein [Anaerolineae bacterium]